MTATKGEAKDARQQREAAALRENLKRRKQQARARRETESDAPTSETSAAKDSVMTPALGGAAGANTRDSSQG